MAGRLEGRVADAHEELALLRYTALDAEYGDIDQAMAFVRRVPWLADGLDDVEEHRAAADTGRRATMRSRRSATPAAPRSSSSRRCWRWRPTPPIVPV